MAFIGIPARSGEAHYTQRTTLDGRIYELHFDWNQRLRRWTLGLYTSNGDPLLQGKVLSVGVDLLDTHRNADPRFPQGILFLIGNYAGEEPGYSELGNVFILVFTDE